MLEPFAQRAEPGTETTRIRPAVDAPARGSFTYPPSQRPGVSLLWVANVILARRRLVFGIPILLAAATVAYVATRAPNYTASTSFTPRSTDIPKSGLGDIAAQFGVTVPTGDPSRSPDFYADVLVSRPILHRIVDTTYSVPGKRAPVSLADILEARGNTPAERTDDAMRILKSRIAISKNQKTGVVTFGVTTHWREVSVAIAQRLLDLVNAFNLQTRQAKANDEARFAEERVSELNSQLHQAEEELALFLQRNRAWRGSPELSLEQQRLDRKVSMRQQVYTTLVQLYEQVRLDALRTTPVISVVEPPEAPARPNSKHLALKTLLTLVFGTALMLLIVFARELFNQGASAHTDDLAEFRLLRREALADVKNPLRVVGAMFSRSGTRA